MKTSSMILGLASLLWLGALAWAQNNGTSTNTQTSTNGQKADMKGNHKAAAMAAMRLTPDQKQKIDEMRNAAMRQAEPLHKEKQNQMAEMKGLWLADKPDPDAIARKQAEMDSTRQKLRAIWTDFHLQMHGVLTPAQRAKWAEHFGAMGGKGRGMQGRMGCPCMDGCEPPNGSM